MSQVSLSYIFVSVGSESFFGKNVKRKKEKGSNAKQCHLNITTIKAIKFGMTLFNGTYL